MKINFEYTLIVELIGFNDDHTSDIRERIKNDSKVIGLSNWNDGVAIYSDKDGLRRRKSLILDMFCLKCLSALGRCAEKAVESRNLEYKFRSHE